MGKSNTWEAGLLNLLFNNAAFGGVGDTSGLQPSAAAGSLYVSLHTADPGEAGDQTTSEAAYTGYARVAVVRSGVGWTISGTAPSQAANAAAVTFPACTGGSSTCTHFGIGTLISGAGKLLYSGPLGKLEFAFTAKASNDTLTIPGHDFAVNDNILFEAIEGGALPTGIAQGTIYFVKTVSGNDVTISTTQGGATLDVTADGSGIAFKDVSLAVSNGITPSFAIGQLAVQEQ